MSLFIGMLAFGDSGEPADLVKLGVMTGSGMAAILGSLILGSGRPATVAERAP